MHAIHRVIMTLLLCFSVLPAHSKELLISAAASLTNSFNELATAYRKQHPDTEIKLNFAASGVLLQQIAKGAPVDLFASADQETLDKAAKQNLIQSTQRRNFARNALVLIAPANTQLTLTQLADLNQTSITKLAIGNPDSVPAGRYGQQALEQVGIWSSIQPKLIKTQNVRQALDYVARGEVDAGLVYQTDALQANDRVKILLSIRLPQPILYPIAPITGSTQPETQTFIQYLLSGEGQQILARYGFTSPDAR